MSGLRGYVVTRGCELRIRLVEDLMVRNQSRPAPAILRSQRNSRDGASTQEILHGINDQAGTDGNHQNIARNLNVTVLGRWRRQTDAQFVW